MSLYDCPTTSHLLFRTTTNETAFARDSSRGRTGSCSVTTFHVGRFSLWNGVFFCSGASCPEVRFVVPGAAGTESRSWSPQRSGWGSSLRSHPAPPVFSVFTASGSVCLGDALWPSCSFMARGILRRRRRKPVSLHLCPPGILDLAGPRFEGVGNRICITNELKKKTFGLKGLD